MTLQFAISPDVNIQNVTDWFIFNTKLQRITGEAFHPTAYTDFADLHSAFEENRADLVYANAADTAYLVRDKGYLPIAWASGMAKEATVVVSADSEIQKVTDLTSPLTAAATDAPDVERICRILLEPADLAYPDIEVSLRPNPVLVAKAVMQGQGPGGFFPQNAHGQLSSGSQLHRAHPQVIVRTTSGECPTRARASATRRGSVSPSRSAPPAGGHPAMGRS